MGGMASWVKRKKGVRGKNKNKDLDKKNEKGERKNEENYIQNGGKGLIMHLFIIEMHKRYPWIMVLLCFNCDTICPGSSDPFIIVSYYIKWVTTSWTHSKIGLIRVKTRIWFVKMNFFQAYDPDPHLSRA